MWEEAGVTEGKSMLTHGEHANSTFEPGPSPLEVRVLTTIPPFGSSDKIPQKN